MLRITIHEGDESIEMALAGRLAGLWVDELHSAWNSLVPNLAGRRISLDLRDLTYSDAQGIQVLKAIFNATGAEFLSGSVWSRYLANEISNTNGTHEMVGGVEHGNHAE